MRLCLFFIFFTALSSNLFAAKGDSSAVKKACKNHIQFGRTGISFMDRYGFRMGRSEENNIQLEDFSISLARTISKYQIGFTYFRYVRLNFSGPRGGLDWSEANRGDVLLRAVEFVNINIGRVFLLKNFNRINIQIVPQAHFIYRFGFGDELALYQNPVHGLNTEFVSTRGPGIGTGVEASVFFYNHISLSLNLCYWHVFEERVFVDNDEPPLTHSIPKNMFVFQPKIGFHF